MNEHIFKMAHLNQAKDYSFYIIEILKIAFV
jgi:hypothetical protein